MTRTCEQQAHTAFYCRHHDRSSPDFAEWTLQLENFRPNVVLERRIAETIEATSGGEPRRID